jgi:hypothetical protein
LPAQTRYFFSKYGQFLHVFVRRFDAQKSLGASSGHHFVLAWGAFWCPGSGHQPGHHFADQRVTPGLSAYPSERLAAGFGVSRRRQLSA